MTLGSQLAMAEGPPSKVSAKCLEPLLKAIEQAEGNGKSASNVVPIECQYYRVEELDQSIQARLVTAMKRKSKSVTSDKRLSEVFGLLINDDVEPINVPSDGAGTGSSEGSQECEKALLNLNDSRKLYFAKVDATKTKDECNKVAKQTGFHDKDINHSTCGNTTYAESSQSFKRFCEEHKEEFLGGMTLPRNTLLSDMLGKLPFSYNSVASAKCKSKPR